MIITLVPCLGVGALALAIVWARLRPRAARLTTVEQSFRFHALRDDVQNAAIRGLLQPESDLYIFLLRSTNLAIKNAGVFRLRDFVRLVRAVEHNITRSDSTIANQLSHAHPEVQRIATAFFSALSGMLVANDWIVRSALPLLVWSMRTWKRAQPALEHLRNFTKRLSPEHAEALRFAVKSQTASMLGG